MSSTLLGLILGIVLAAVLTTRYADTWNHVVRQVIPEGQPPAVATATPRQTPVTVAPVTGPAADAVPVATVSVDAAAAALAATPSRSETDGTEIPADDRRGTRLPAERHGSAGASGDELEARWAAFAERAGSLQPVGDYRWRDCFTRAAAAYDVAETLLLAIASGESNFDPAARSDKDAIGLMQIRWPGTSRHLGVLREAELYDPCTNVAAGARYIAELSERFEHDLHRAVAAYNYGPTPIESGEMPAGARWYSQYIYQHLQRILGEPHVPTSTLIPPGNGPGGHLVLSRFNRSARARDFAAFIEAQIPELRLALRSEALGQHEVVLLYEDEAQRRRALAAIGNAGLLALTNDAQLTTAF